MILGEINEGHSQDSNLNLCDLDPFQKSSLLQEKKNMFRKFMFRNKKDLRLFTGMKRIWKSACGFRNKQKK